MGVPANKGVYHYCCKQRFGGMIQLRRQKRYFNYGIKDTDLSLYLSGEYFGKEDAERRMTKPITMV